MMREGSLFTGTAALGMAATDVLGSTPAWFCDVDPGASTLLAHHYPRVPNLGDITTVDWSAVEPVDVLTGGFPCQDISNAGKRAGIEGGRSGLWSYFANAIRVLRPRYVLIENVAALVVRGLDRVLADLAAIGFDAEWTAVRASDVGGPHRRERIFITAADAGRVRGKPRGITASSETSGGGPLAISGVRGGVGAGRRRLGGSDAAECGAPSADPNGDGCEGEPQRDSGSFNDQAKHQPQRVDADGRFLDWGPYEPAIQRWETILGRPAPAPTVIGARGGRVLNPALPEWMMGLPSGWITSVPGLSRSDQLRLAGNGVVPLQAATAYRHLLDRLATA